VHPGDVGTDDELRTLGFLLELREEGGHPQDQEGVAMGLFLPATFQRPRVLLLQVLQEELLSIALVFRPSDDFELRHV
jgi:hypothetical protein